MANEIIDDDDVSMSSEEDEEMQIEPEEQGGLYRPPTAQEALDLKQADLFKDNLFKLQIQELLKKATIPKVKGMQETLFQLRDFLLAMDMNKFAHPMTFDEMAIKLKVMLPTTVIDPETNLKFAFKNPKKVAVLGSFLLETFVRNPQNENYVDLGLEMVS